MKTFVKIVGSVFLGVLLLGILSSPESYDPSPLVRSAYRASHASPQEAAERAVAFCGSFNGVADDLVRAKVAGIQEARARSMAMSLMTNIPENYAAVVLSVLEDVYRDRTPATNLPKHRGNLQARCLRQWNADHGFILDRRT